VKNKREERGPRDRVLAITEALMRRLLLGLLLGLLIAAPTLQAQMPPWRDGSAKFNCIVTNSTATTLTTLGGGCAAPGMGLSLYITSITASASVISATTEDQYLSIKSGIG